MLWILVSLLLLLFNGASVYLISIKLFNVSFFGDLELLVRIWNLIFLILVVLIRRRVIIFSFSYMRGIATNNFIFLYLSFVVRIIWLILNNNFYWIIFGWDGLGVVSFLLIVYYINNESITNGLFTIFQNRFGDLFFVLFILGIRRIMIWRNIVLLWGGLFLIIGRCVKRAQFPFNAWLLAAIRAPTPISSLVHSSTLVVAGVYILLQYRYCLVDVLEVLKYISLLRLLLRTFGLLNERDMKKLIAYSTMSHVSLIIYLLSFKLFKVVYFHLNIHAIFKSLIFICFGFVILFSFHSQDKRLVSLINLNPVIKIIYYFSCLCLAGLPFLRGFFSKDLIIEKFIENSLECRFIFFLLIFLGVRVYYRIKLILLSKIYLSLNMIEKQVLGINRVLIIRIFIVLLINIYLRLVFSLSLEFFSFKIVIYLFMIVFFLLRLLTNLNFKIVFFSKIHNFKESWFLNLYRVDKFMYWNFFLLMEYMSVGIKVKIIVLINWWVIVGFLILF